MEKSGYKVPEDNDEVAVTTAVDSDDKLKSSEERTATLLQVFSTADYIDIICMTLGTLGGIITGLSLPIFNILFGRMLNQLNGTASSFASGIANLCIAFVCIAAINVFSGFFQVYFWSFTGERQTQKFRVNYVNAILSQEIGWFDTCGASELATRVADISGKIQDGLGRKMGDLIQYLTQIIASYAVAFYLSWRLAIVLIASFPLIAGSGAFMINAITAATTQSLSQYAAAGGVATEALSAIRTVSALNAQPQVIERYRKFLFESMQVGIKKGFNVGLGNGMLFCACFFTYALGFWYGAKLVSHDLESGCTQNCLNGGKVLSVFFCTVIGSMGLGQLAPPMTAFSTARAAIGMLLNTTERKPLIDGLSTEGTTPDTRATGEIELKDVNFCYPSRPNITVCKDYSLKINAGDTVALVGASGCGKSTIINLLMRFYDPQSGVITLDGRNIKELNIRWLRSCIGYVGQEPILFAGTVADNISYGLDPELLGNTAETANGAKKLSAEELREKVIAAAKLANAHEFIMNFPQGYDTDVGSNGVAMSGGQKQRIAIARALVKKPAVLLLDEATSALDASSERVVQESIDVLQRSKAQTTIVIAHRLSTIRNADKICLIHRGSIAEIGTHDELIAKNGLYADLVRLQMSGLDEDQQDNPDDLPPAPANEPPSKKGGSPRTGRKRTVSGDAGKGTQSAEDIEQGPDGDDDDDDEENGELAASEKKPSLSKQESTAVSSRIWAMVMQHWQWLVAACVGAIVFGGVFPAWGYMLSYTQAMFFLSDPVEMRRKGALYAELYIMLGVVSLVASTFQFWGVAQVAERVSIKLRSQMFEALMRRNIGFFDFEENNIGNLTTRLADDSRIVNKAFGDSLARQLQAFFCLAVALVLGFTSSWKVAFVVVAAFPINIVASAIHMQAIAGQQYESEQDDAVPTAADRKSKKSNGTGASGSGGGGVVSGGHGAIISTAFTHMRTVSAFSMQHKVSEEYAKITQGLADGRTHRSAIGGFAFGASQGALFCTYALLFWYGSTLIKSGEISFREMMGAILTLMLGALGLGQALADLGDQKAGVETADRIFKCIDEAAKSPIDGLATTGIIPGDKATGKIVIKDVNFVYPTRPDAQVCKSFNLTIEPGEMVAFVGPSGSGKSTIINLLLRFYDPASGSITIDGVDTKLVNIRWLRSQMGYVGQEPVLFAGNVRENIAKGRVGSLTEPVISLEEAMKNSDAAQYSIFSECQSLCIKDSTQKHSAIDEKAVIPTAENDVEMGTVGGANAAVDEDILEACKASNAHDFITTFPKGYDTDIGEGSIMVSGGQKQRIAIARALIKKPSILLLDEATSALDATSERKVQESIDKLQQTKAQTSIVIAHRLSTIRNADKIIVIDKGVVVESGNHDELLSKNGLYAQLWAKQGGTTPQPSPVRR